MGLSFEDRVLIKNLHELKGYGAKRLIKEFPTKQWKLSTLSYFLKHVKEHDTIGRKSGSGKLKTSRTPENVAAVAELVLSQENAPQTHSTTRQIARRCGIAQSSFA